MIDMLHQPFSMAIVVVSGMATILSTLVGHSDGQSARISSAVTAARIRPSYRPTSRWRSCAEWVA